MSPYYEIFGIRLASYGSLISLGIILAVIVYWYRKKIYLYDKEQILYSAIYGLIFAFIGAKLLYIITDFQGVVDLLRGSLSFTDKIKYLLTGGYVFYGGILGGIAGVYLYCKKQKIPFVYAIDSLAPEVPLAHAFGRIGCFFAGCCYGIPYNGAFCVKFPKNTIGLAGVNLFPVQLLNSLLNFICFIILFLYSRKERRGGKVSGLYIVLYGIGRFFTEFLRYDSIRGHMLWFSTSQWISLMLLPLGLLLFFKGDKLCKKRTEN